MLLEPGLAAGHGRAVEAGQDPSPVTGDDVWQLGPIGVVVAHQPLVVVLVTREHRGGTPSLEWPLQILQAGPAVGSDALVEGAARVRRLGHDHDVVGRVRGLQR